MCFQGSCFKKSIYRYARIKNAPFATCRTAVVMADGIATTAHVPSSFRPSWVTLGWQYKSYLCSCCAFYF